MDVAGRIEDRHTAGFLTDIFKGMLCAAWNNDKLATFGNAHLVSKNELDLAFQNNIGLFFTGVTVQGRTRARGDDGLDQAECAIRFMAEFVKMQQVSQQVKTSLGCHLCVLSVIILASRYETIVSQKMDFKGLKRERLNQKARTRIALLRAAQELAAEGKEITVPAVAAHARISKATAYRYFSDPVTLAADAALDLEVASTDSLLGNETDVRKRVHAITDYYRAFSRSHELTFRKYVSRVLDEWTPGTKVQRRGARRIPALEIALEPVRPDLPPKKFADLVIMLAACATGFEQNMVLTDICGLSYKEADRIGREVVDAILDKYGID